MRLRSILALALLLAPALFARDAPPDLAARRKALADVVEEAWQYRLKTNPEEASIVGDKRYNDRLADRSPQAIDDQAEHAQRFLKRAQAVDTTGFPEQEALNKTILVQELQNELEEHTLKNYEMPINQLSGIYVDIPRLVSLLSFDSEKDYVDWTARLHQTPRAFAETIALMQQGMKDHLTPPQFILEQTAVEIEGIAAQKPEESPFAKPLAKMPASIPAERQQELRARLLAVITTDVLPAYGRLARFVRAEYIPNARTADGIWALPDGAARYASAVRIATTTKMTPDEIHALGLKQVANDETEMLAIAKKLGFDSIKALDTSIEKNPELHAKSREQILDIYRKAIAQMTTKLPTLFGRLPKQQLTVVPIEPFLERTSPAAFYEPGTKDGSRAGRISVNTSSPEKRKTITMETTAYHEGIPGHHLQTAIALELPDLPPFRQQPDFVAFSEGWGVYSERLAKEAGFYSDPYSDYGRLQTDMLRAIRLVVDTGLHAKKWTRQQVVDYFHAHSSTDETLVQVETDRYIAWPAQALGYKVGQLEIIALRTKAEKALGKRFDVRKFHDEVLSAGSIPLDVLDARIDQWIRGQQGGK